MFVSPRYLERFKLTFADEIELFALVPTEIALHGFEQTGATSVVLDAPIGGEYPEAAGVLHQDTNPDYLDAWELDPALRKTLVTVPGQTVGWLFDGLLAPEDVRAWVRNRFEIPSPELGPALERESD